MQKYFDLAKEEGYDVQVLRCVGQYGNTHGVPEESVQKMLDRFEDYEGEILVGENNFEEDETTAEDLSKTFMGEED